MPSNICDLKSSAMRRMHSCGPVAAVGSIPTKPGNISFVMSMPTCVSAIRASVCSVAVSGGGHGLAASHVRNDLRAVSLARRKLKAVEPCARESEPEQRGDDLLLAYLGVQGVPLLHLEPIDEQADDLVDHDTLAQLVERGLRVERFGQDVKTFSPGVVAEFIRSRPAHRQSRPVHRRSCPVPGFLAPGWAGTSVDHTGRAPATPHHSRVGTGRPPRRVPRGCREGCGPGAQHAGQLSSRMPLRSGSATFSSHSISVPTTCMSCSISPSKS